MLRRENTKAILSKIDKYDGPELGRFIKEPIISNHDGNGEVQPSLPSNLMFESNIGPSRGAC